MKRVPFDWMDNVKMNRIILHWTAGSHAATELDRKHYHLLVEGDGRLVKGEYGIKANESTRNGYYAAHTAGLNTRSIGVAMCGMRGSTPNSIGDRPLMPEQVEATVDYLAHLCFVYELDPSDRKKLLGHSEVEKVYGIKQAGKWDVDWLPYFGYAPDSCMGWIRTQVSKRLDELKKSLSPEPKEEAAQETKSENRREVVQVQKTIANMGGRKFVLSVLGVIGIVLNARLGLNITEDMIEKIVNLIMVFVLAEGSGDIVGRLKAATKK